MTKKEEFIFHAKDSRWFNYMLFYEFVAQQHFNTYAEVGCGKGHSTFFLAQAVLKDENTVIYAIDKFVSPLKEMYEFNKKPYPDKVKDIIHEIPGISWEVAHQFEDGYFDFVFIDADHAYESVRKDILAYLPKVRKGGILAGHDYVESQPGVRKAVDEIFGNNKKVQIDYDEQTYTIGENVVLEKFPKSYCWYVEL